MYYPNSNSFECDGCDRIEPILGNKSLRDTWFAMWQHGWRAWALSMHSCPACEAVIAAETGGETHFPRGVTHMNLPNNAIDFVAFMEHIWDADDPLYNLCRNALKTVRLCGARRTGGSFIDGIPATVFRFPADGNRFAVLIHNDGNGCKVSINKFSTKPRQKSHP